MPSPSEPVIPLSWTELETKQEYFQKMLDVFCFGVALLDEKLRIRMVNSVARAVFDVPGRIRGRRFRSFLPPEIQPLYADFDERIARGERSVLHEHDILRPDGSRRVARCLLGSFTTPEGGLLTVLVIRDITAIKNIQDRCEVSEKRYHMLFDVAADAMMVVSSDGTLLEVNNMLCSHIGRDRDELVGRNMNEVLSPNCRKVAALHIAEALEKGVRTFEASLVSRVSPIPVEISAQRFESQDQAAVLCIARDITEHKMLLARLEYQASIDPLTTLHNRRHFMFKAEQEFLRFKRYGNGFAMLMMDLDFFKKVNDTYGHQTGDDLLREFARQMRKAFRHSDILGRIGGEEFSVLLLESSLYKGIEAAERLRRQVESQPMSTGYGAVPYTVSIGVTTAASVDAGLDMIMHRADAALYRAKRNGRNQVEFAQGT